MNVFFSGAKMDERHQTKKSENWLRQLAQEELTKIPIVEEILKQRLPKFGFTSRKSLTHGEVRLAELNKVEGEIVDMLSLKAAGLISNNVKSVKVMLSGEISKPVTVKGIPVSKGAKAAIEAAGGKVED